MDFNQTADISFGRGKSYNINRQIFLDFNDDYDHIDETIEYIIENELMSPPSESHKSLSSTSPHSAEEVTRNETSYETLKTLYNSCYTVSCNCNSENSTDCCNKDVNCLHGGNYSIAQNYKNAWEIVLNKNRKIQDLIYECSAQCKCPSTCLNRLVQYGPRKHLQITKIPHMNNQLGVITALPILEGSFICEYAGEILTKEEACIRETFNTVHKLMNYIICLNEYSTEFLQINNDQKSGSEGEKKGNDDTAPPSRIQTFIDPSQRGNIGRYLNHSCEPNCEILSVRIDSPLPKLGM